MTNPLKKGAEEWMEKQKYALRATIYALVTTTSFLYMFLIIGTWASLGFMRQDGTLIGALGVLSGVVTGIIGSMYTISAIFMHRNESSAPIFAHRVCTDHVEMLISCLMAGWWIALSLANTNMAFVFRQNITQCLDQRLQADCSSACKAFCTDVALGWFISNLWIIRVWRVYIRVTKGFDSSVFCGSPSQSDTVTQSITTTFAPFPHRTRPLATVKTTEGSAHDSQCAYLETTLPQHQTFRNNQRRQMIQYPVHAYYHDTGNDYNPPIRDFRVQAEHNIPTTQHHNIFHTEDATRPSPNYIPITARLFRPSNSSHV